MTAAAAETRDLYRAAATAISDALGAIAKAVPQARDYRDLPPTAFTDAQARHRQWLVSLGDVRNALEAVIAPAPAPPVHLVRGWTGLETDETPFCGADKRAPQVWGSRTASPAHVTCEACKAVYDGGDR